MGRLEGAPVRRVVVWATGGIGSLAIRAVNRRRDLELVGVWVHSPEKDGRDAGELAGTGPIGLAATNDADALLALRPDCVVYAAQGPQRDAAAMPDYVRFLEAGVNVVTATTTRLVYPPAFDPEWRAELEAAAAAGGATIYASGIWPGFVSDFLPIALLTQCDDVRSVRAAEVEVFAHYPVASSMADGMGFGMPLDFECWLSKPGFVANAWGGPVRLIADALGVELDEIRGRYERAPSDRRLEVAFGVVEPGTCGAIRMEAIGVVDGKEMIVIEHVARMAPDLAPEWPHDENDAFFYVDIDADPPVHCRMYTGGPHNDEGGGSMMSTAMRVVNAIPHVVDAAPGLVSFLDIPLTVPRP